ncbi:VOC family protein [Sphingobium sp. WCS2017Hpa-17]|uniref:VOC family protein n=1 Tax=Sphingobium sp. WCS2017Hpa-17 TaxID=3073638 RepID=UPI00288BE58F|nr:VOC family protein [Sphingobium sp. WCS2017Hpa-17]
MISSLAYVVLKAPDLGAWQAFGCDTLGLMRSAASDEDSLFLRMDDRPFRFAIEKADGPSFVAGGWELPDQASFEICISKLRAAGVEVLDGDAGLAARRQVKGIATCKDPSGNGVELHWGRIVDYEPFLSPSAVSGFVTGEMGLGHLVLPAGALSDTLDFYKNILGFRDTDYIRVPLSPEPDGPAAQVHFLHCDNARHHSVALTDMPQPAGAVHVMVEAKTIDDVGYALDRVKASGAHLSASLGRHTNDKMLSFYVRTPNGFDIEFGTGGWQVDWSTYVPTISLKDSAWGHEWNFAGV